MTVLSEVTARLGHGAHILYIYSYHVHHFGPVLYSIVVEPPCTHLTVARTFYDPSLACLNLKSKHAMECFSMNRLWVV